MALLQMTLAPTGKLAVFLNADHITSLVEVLIPGPEVISTTKIVFTNGKEIQVMGKLEDIVQKVKKGAD